jgi:hypothetical protein
MVALVTKARVAFDNESPEKLLWFWRFWIASNTEIVLIVSLLGGNKSIRLEFAMWGFWV